MIKLLALALRPFLYLPPVRRVRRNHGLEHATIHVLSRDIRGSMAGRAVIDGFYIYGNLKTTQVLDAVQEAIDRMRRGEHILAIHPNCGTGLVTSGFLTSLAVIGATIGTNQSFFQRLRRLPVMVTLSIIALIVSQPAGLSLQRHITTLGDPGNMELVDVKRQEIQMPFAKSPMIVHRVWTKQG
jgi:hypothetical protein